MFNGTRLRQDKSVDTIRILNGKGEEMAIDGSGLVFASEKGRFKRSPHSWTDATSGIECASQTE